MGDGDWKTTVFDKDGTWHGTTRDVEEMTRENDRELWRRMHDTGDSKKDQGLPGKSKPEKEEKKMGTIVYIFKETIAEDRATWQNYWLRANDKNGVGVLSLKEIAKQLIDEIDEGRVRGDVYIITRPPDELLLCKDSGKNYQPLSMNEQEKLQQYFNIKGVVG